MNDKDMMMKRVDPDDIAVFGAPRRSASVVCQACGHKDVVAGQHHCDDCLRRDDRLRRCA